MGRLIGHIAMVERGTKNAPSGKTLCGKPLKRKVLGRRPLLATCTDCVEAMMHQWDEPKVTTYKMQVTLWGDPPPGA